MTSIHMNLSVSYSAYNMSVQIFIYLSLVKHCISGRCIAQKKWRVWLQKAIKKNFYYLIFFYYYSIYFPFIFSVERKLSSRKKNSMEMLNVELFYFHSIEWEKSVFFFPQVNCISIFKTVKLLHAKVDDLFKIAMHVLCMCIKVFKKKNIYIYEIWDRFKLSLVT